MSEPAATASQRLSQRVSRSFVSLGVRNYRLFFIGQGVSLTGTWMRRVVMGWLVYELTVSNWEVGMVTALSLFPMFLFAPLAGAVADRVDKRRLIIASQVVPAAMSLLLAALIATDAIQLWHMKSIVAVQGMAFAFEIPARQAFVVEMVGRDKLRNAIALNSALVNLSRIIGPSVAGFVMWAVGYAACFTLDALSYVAVIGTLLSLRLPPFRVAPRKGSQLEHLAGGAREVLRNRPVRLTLSLLFLTGVFGWSYNTVMPVIAQDHFQLSKLQYGVLMSMFGVGAIVGAMVVAARHLDESLEGQLAAGLSLMAAGLFGVALSPAFLPMALALLVAGFGAVMFVSTGNTLVQLSVRGRVMGIWALAFGGSLPLGNLLVGKTAEYLSPFQTIGLYTGIMVGCCVLVFALHRWRKARGGAATPASVGPRAGEQPAT